MERYIIEGTTLTNIANAIRSKTGNTEPIQVMEMASEISSISGGGTGGADLPSLSNPALASDILSGKEAINSNGEKITGSIVTKTSSNLTASGATVTVPAGYYASESTKSVSTITQAIPSITVDGSGKITARATQRAGYVAPGTKSATKQLATRGGEIITPGTSDKTAIKSGYYATGSVYVKGDANLKAENIKSGVSIFGVNGSYTGSTEDLNSISTELENKVATLNASLDSKAAEKGTQIAIGTVVSDGVMLNVDDLPFTPQYVAVFPCANELHKMRVLGSSEIGVFNGVNYSSESEISGGTGGTSCDIRLSNIEITDNGFSVMPVEVDLADEYRYIAIG